MKKTAVLLLLFILLWLACSCKAKVDYLSYQENELTVHCTVNGKYKIAIHKQGSCSKIEISEPNELSSVSFEIYENEAYAISSDVKIPLELSALKGICALVGAFSLEKETQGAVKDEDGKSIVTFNTDAGCYVITYDKSLLPTHIEISSDSYYYDVVVDEVEYRG